MTTEELAEQLHAACLNIHSSEAAAYAKVLEINIANDLWDQFADLPQIIRTSTTNLAWLKSFRPIAQVATSRYEFDVDKIADQRLYLARMMIDFQNWINTWIELHPNTIIFLDGPSLYVNRHAYDCECFIWANYVELKFEAVDLDPSKYWALGAVYNLRRPASKELAC